MKIRAVLLSLVVAVAAGASGVASAAPRYAFAKGSFVSGPCFEASSRAYEPTTKTFHCDAMSWLDGAWTGTGTSHASGTVDPLTGHAQGRVDARLDIRTASGATGQLVLVGRLTVNGTTGRQLIVARVVRASGAVRAVTGGTMTFSAYTPVTGGPADGDYVARWRT